MNSVFLSSHMFAGQTRKRTRDFCDDDDGDVLLLGEQRFHKTPRTFEIHDFSPTTQKSSTSLPFRPTCGELSDSYDPSLLTISPPESDESASSSPANEKASSTYSPICSSDVDMADFITSSTVTSNLMTTSNTVPFSYNSHVMAPPARPVTRPARLNPESLNYNPSGGRLPTPIHGYFLKPQQASQQQEAQQHPLQQADFQPPTHSFQLKTHNASIKRPSNIKVRVPSGAHMLQQPSSHMLPSPISEGDPDVLAGAQLARLSVVGEDAMDVEDEKADTTVEPSAVNIPTKSNADSTTENAYPATMSAFDPLRTDHPASTSKSSGRERRRSLTVPSEKKRFCMGYRADCEKCRLRVPGHFSHFLS